jgi:hydrogenase expression/formation protein HypE
MRTFYPTGKIPPQILKNMVFKHLGVKSRKLILGPAIGEDAAMISTGKKIIIVKTDPITGALKNMGWLSVHVNANDIATRGVRPQWYLSSILLPEKCAKEVLEDLVHQIDRAAKELGIAVVGGHSEVTLGLQRPLVIGFMIGETEKGKYVTSHDARPGDVIVLTKEAGIEGTAILATDIAHMLRKGVGEKVLVAARRLIRRISVVKDSQIAMSTGGVDAMHDPTEGGIVNGVWELAEASKCGCIIEESRVPLAVETDLICHYLKIDPLKVMSSGALLMAVRPNRVNTILSNFGKAGIRATAIGKIVSSRKGRVIVKKSGKIERLKPPRRDHLYIALERFGG